MTHLKQMSPWRRYLLFHLSLLILSLLYIGIAILDRFVEAQILFCPLKALTHLYCPFCGGTRALFSLLSFDFVAAFRYNAAFCLFLLAFAVFDIIALIRLCRGVSSPLSLPRILMPVFLSALVIWTLGRNLLLIIWGFDPIGDLFPFYHTS